MLRSTAAVGVRPVTQRTTGWPNGECVRAAYAAILHLPIEDVPRFDPADLRPGEEQMGRERTWLASLQLPGAPRGFLLREIKVPPEETLPAEVLDAVPEIEHLMSGLSLRGHYHRVVGRGGRVIWDPHPSRAGLLTCYALGFLVPR